MESANGIKPSTSPIKRKLETVQEESDEIANKPRMSDKDTERNLLVSVLNQCKANKMNVIVDVCNNLERTTVILCNPEFSEELIELDSWRRSKIHTLYLFSESDEILQESIQSIVKKCSFKLFLRLFSRKLPLENAMTHLPLAGWMHVLGTDDRAPPFRRVMVMVFRFGKMTMDDREGFLDRARHEVADLIIFERTNVMAIGEWAALMRRHSGLPSENAVVLSPDGKAFGMLTRFFHQGEAAERLFMRKGSSEGNLTHLAGRSF